MTIQLSATQRPPSQIEETNSSATRGIIGTVSKKQFVADGSSEMKPLLFLMINHRLIVPDQANVIHPQI